MASYSKVMITAVAALLIPVSSFADHDKRKTVFLDERERVTILNQMQYFMDGVIQITQALAKKDMKAVATVAKSRGKAMPEKVPVEVRQQLPKGFTDIGMMVHQDFDQLALDAASFSDVNQSMRQLSTILQRCHNCHLTYQIRSSTYDAMDHME